MAATFDSSADSLTLAAAARSGSWSFSALIRNAVDRNDFAAYGPTFDNGGAYYLGLGTSNDGLTPVMNTNDPSAPGSPTGPGGALPDVTVGSTWHFVGGSYNSTSGLAAAYLGVGESGSSLTARSGTFPTGKSGTAILYVGNNSFLEWWNGSVKEVRIWNSALTQAEFEAEWASPTAIVKSGAWAYYPLGSNANDASGNARHLTVNGTVTFDVVVNTQIIRPDGDVTRVGWVDSAAGTTNLWASLDEVSPSDVDYITVSV